MEASKLHMLNIFVVSILAYFYETERDVVDEGNVTKRQLFLLSLLILLLPSFPSFSFNLSYLVRAVDSSTS